EREGGGEIEREVERLKCRVWSVYSAQIEIINIHSTASYLHHIPSVCVCVCVCVCVGVCVCVCVSERESICPVYMFMCVYAHVYVGLHNSLVRRFRQKCLLNVYMCMYICV